MYRKTNNNPCMNSIEQDKDLYRGVKLDWYPPAPHWQFASRTPKFEVWRARGDTNCIYTTTDSTYKHGNSNRSNSNNTNTNTDYYLARSTLTVRLSDSKVRSRRTRGEG